MMNLGILNAIKSVRDSLNFNVTLGTLTHKIECEAVDGIYKLANDHLEDIGGKLDTLNQACEKLPSRLTAAFVFAGTAVAGAFSPVSTLTAAAAGIGVSLWGMSGMARPKHMPLISVAGILAGAAIAMAHQALPVVGFGIGMTLSAKAIGLMVREPKGVSALEAMSARINTSVPAQLGAFLGLTPEESEAPAVQVAQPEAPRASGREAPQPATQSFLQRVLMVIANAAAAVYAYAQALFARRPVGVATAPAVSEMLSGKTKANVVRVLASAVGPRAPAPCPA